MPMVYQSPAQTYFYQKDIIDSIQYPLFDQNPKMDDL